MSDSGMRYVIQVIKELFSEVEKDAGGVGIALLVIIAPTLISFLITCWSQQRNKNGDSNPYYVKTQFKPMFALIVATLILYGAFRTANPLPPNFYNILGHNPTSPNLLLKRTCNKFSTDSMTTEQENACFTFERRVRRKFYDRVGPGYLKCETCSDEWSYFLGTNSGFMLWFVVYILFVLAIVSSSNKMTTLTIPLYVFAFCTAIGQFMLFTVIPTFEIYGYVNFEIAYLLLDFLCVMTVIFIIHRHFTGGDYRTNHDIIVNINKLNHKMNQLSILLLMPERVAFTDASGQTQERQDGHKQSYRERDRFITRLYKGNHIGDAFLNAVHQVIVPPKPQQGPAR